VPGDVSCFPRQSQITSVPFATIFETAPPTLYVAPPNTYNIWTGVTQVPEPGTLLVLGGGLAVLGAIAWRRRV